MSRICIKPPSQLPVSLDLARRNLRVDGPELDDLIITWVHGITSALEGKIGQCIMEQTWRVTLDGFPADLRHCIGRRGADNLADAIEMPHPVIEVEAVRYVDSEGVAQELAPAAFVMRRARYHSALVPAPGSAWPSTAPGSTVTIDVRCGYGETEVSTPHEVRLYILAKLVEQFDPATRAERNAVQSAFVESLLDACRTYA